MSSQLKLKMTRALLWSSVESVINGLCGVGLIIVLAWLLHPEEVGRAGIALAVVGTVEIVAGLGMVEALVGSRSAHTYASDTAFSAVMIASLLGLGTCWVIAGPIAAFYGDPDVALLIRGGALVLPANALLAVPTALLTRKLRAAALTIRMMSGRVFALLATAVLARMDFGAWALVLGPIVGALASSAVLILHMRRWPRARFSGSEFRRLLSFGATLSVERLLWSSMVRFFWLIIGYVHGPTVLGYFQFAQRLVDETATLVQTFAIRFGLSYFSALQRIKRDPADAFLKATRLITMAASPVFAGLALVLPDFIEALFDPRWQPAAFVSQVAAVGWILAFPRVLVGPVLRAQHRQQGLLLYAAAACAVTLIGGAVTGGQSLSMIAIAWIVRHLVGLPWGIYAIKHYLGISATIQFAASMGAYLATALMVVAIVLLKVIILDWNPIPRLLICIPAGAVAYGLGLILFDRRSLKLLSSIASVLRK